LCIDFDFSVIPELQEESDKVVEQMSKSWWLTPNEKRMAMSYGEVEDDESMNDYYIPANLLPINGVENDFEDVINEPVDIDVSKFLVKDVEEIKAPKKEKKKKELVDIEAKKDLFKTKKLAEARAIELGGEGSHKIAGYYMPFKTHQEYVKAKR